MWWWCLLLLLQEAFMSCALFRASKSRHPKQVSAECCVKHVLVSHCWEYWSVDSRKENASKEEFQRLEKWSFSLRCVNEMWVREEWWTWALFVVWVSCASTSLLPLFSPVSAETIDFIYNSRDSSPLQHSEPWQWGLWCHNSEDSTDKLDQVELISGRIYMFTTSLRS